ncbi:regulator [Flavobacterium akiainvivens]|uniref:Regulator n=1 Tax=Flavobacterium akiainvivens TaxID=1202724 RepID=A0A0M8MGX0_9FLAO|nr:regulator [Flavobacterium akiainvivens]SFQ53993.1 regulatory protein, luxR family [Flavobacterium akiainvivens]
MNIMLRTKFLVLLLLMLFSGMSAQVKNIGLPKIINYKKSDYNGGSQNWDIGQDKNGNLYFANTSGLIQFNGTSWSISSIPNETVRSLKIDASGKIYVGGYNEFGYYATNEKGKLIYHSLTHLIGQNSKNIIDFVWKTHIVNGAVFFQTFYKTYIYKDGKVEILEAPNRFQFSFVVNNTLYFQDIVQGLLEYTNGKLIPLKGTEIFNSTEVWGLLPFQDNQLLVVTQDNGLFISDSNGVKPWLCEANDFIVANNSLGGRILADKFIVLNSVLDGIIICDLNGKIIQHINNRKGLQNNTALSSFIDNSSNLWLGLDNGICFINENSPFSYLGTSYGLGAVYGSAVFEGNLYVATNQGVFKHDWKKTFKEESFKFLEGTTGQAWNIQEFDGELFCSHNRGLFLISGGKQGRFLDNKRGYLNVKKIPGRPGFLIASNYHGFAILEKTAAGWQFRNQIDGFNISDSKFTTDGVNVWLRKGSVYRLKLSNDLRNFTTISTYTSPGGKLKDIQSVQDINGAVYFQSDNRFFIYEPVKDQFVEDKKMTALFKNVPKIRYCFQDNKGNIGYFFGKSSMGMLIKMPDGNYRNVQSPFSSLTGNMVYFFESVNTVDNSNIFIGVTEGLVHYNPQLQNIYPQKPNAFIRSFTFSGDTLITGNLKAVKEVHLSYKANNVKFTFSSPIYDNPENILFSYKLEGFEDKWSAWTKNPVKEYTNLREGDYRMQLRVMDSFGKISDPDVISFTIAPPFYRHPLAYLAYILLIAFSVYYIRRRIKVKIRKNKYYETLEQRRLYLERETKIKQEQLELEKEIERLKNEQLKVKILTKDKELVSNSLQVVKKNKMLNGIIHKMKDLETESMDDATKQRFNRVYKTIVKELNTDKSWNNLEKHIRNVHFDFLKRLKDKFPAITPREMDLATYLLMNMSTKEIAEIMNISDGGVELARYRLRKKLNLTRKDNLTGFLMNI